MKLWQWGLVIGLGVVIYKATRTPAGQLTSGEVLGLPVSPYAARARPMTPGESSMTILGVPVSSFGPQGSVPVIPPGNQLVTRSQAMALQARGTGYFVCDPVHTDICVYVPGPGESQ